MDRCESCDQSLAAFRITIIALGGVEYDHPVSFDVCQSCLMVPEDGDHIDVESLHRVETAR